MTHISIFVGLCFIIFTVILEVELTPIVTLPPESVPTTTTTENKQILSTTSEAAVGSVVRLNITDIPNEEDGLSKVEGVNANTMGRLDTNDETTTIIPVISIKDTGNNSSNETVIQPVALSTTEISNQTAQEEEPTTPELVSNTTSSTASTPYIEVTQFSVTSNPITLKSGSTTVQVDKLLEATTSTFAPVENQTANVTTTSNPPVRIISPTGNVSNETEGDYKSKAPVEYHPYIDEILRDDATENNDTTTQVAPIRIKSKGYHSSHNDVNEHPYGPLPKFAEKEMDKLRLNHWRVHQILKGDVHQDLTLGRPATGSLKKDNNMQGKYPQHLSNFLGQKRASSAAFVPVKKSSLDQDEFHSSILASEHDATTEMQTEEPTKLRSFFNWISSPLKKIKSSGSSDEDDERLKQARKQEPILPFALGYRGDFLFW